MKNRFFLYSLFILVGLSSSCEKDTEIMLVQVDAKYEVSRRSIYSTDTIQFTDLSTGEPTSWKWEFVGGTPSTSTEQNPLVSYDYPGLYSVFLEVSNGDTESSFRSVSSIEVKDISIPPYDGTVWVESGILTEDDASAFVSLSYVGEDNRNVYDVREEGFVGIDLWIFEATLDYGKKIEMQVNTEMSKSTAESYARDFAIVVGKLPKFLIASLDAVTIHKNGSESFFGGSGQIIVYADSGEQLFKSGFIEEILIHEAGHVTLDVWYQEGDYLSYRKKDPTYISTYARDNPVREDLSESIGLYLAYRYYPDRLSEQMKYTIKKIMPNRIKFFDQQDFDIYPWK